VGVYYTNSDDTVVYGRGRGAMWEAVHAARDYPNRKSLMVSFRKTVIYFHGPHHTFEDWAPLGTTIVIKGKTGIKPRKE